MHCPYCRHTDTRVLDSRVAEDGSSIRRRRQCPACESRFTTIEQMQLAVIKRSGVVEPFVRDKIVGGVRKACKGRPVNEDQLAKLAQEVEETLRASGKPEVPADEVGVAILGPLRTLDQVAYLRFASVYRQFASVDDFESEIAMLRVEQAPTGIEPLIPEPVDTQRRPRADRARASGTKSRSVNARTTAQAGSGRSRSGPPGPPGDRSSP